MKQLLVPIDFSVESDQALKFACQIARKKDFIVDVVNVFSPPKPQSELLDFDLLTYQKECNELNWKRLTSYLSQEKFDGVQIRINQVELNDEQDVSEVIVSLATKNDSSLVIMGNKQVNGLSEIINDSVAAKVMRGLKIPFISLKGFLPQKQIQNILYTSEFNETDVSKFEFVNLLIELFQAKTHFLFVDTTANKNRVIERERLMKMKQITEHWKLSDYKLLIKESEDLHAGITSFLEDQPVDLIVVGYHENRVEKHEIEGSLAEDLIHEFPSPVLTLKY